MKKFLSGLALTLLLFTVTTFASGRLWRKEGLGNHLTSQQQTLRRTAVILFNFENDTSQPLSVEAARSVVFTGSNSVTNYYKEVSFDKVLVTGALRPDGDVFGWFTIPYDNTYPNCGLHLHEWSTAAETLAEAQGFVRSNYDTIIYGMSDGHCNFTGSGYAGYPGRAWLSHYVYFNPTTIAHEVGHTYGRSHAHALNCFDLTGSRVTLSSTCSSIEYGNPFSVMANGQGHMTAYEKNVDYIGSWFLPENIQSVTSAGDYFITPLELATGGVQMLRIARSGGSYLNLEFRRSIGFDRNGYTINYPGPLVYLNGELLDTTPETVSFSDAALTEGKVFRDSAYGIVITTMAVSDAGAGVHVEFDPAACSLNTPTLDLTPQTQTGGARQALSYGFKLSSNNILACGPTNYSITANVPTGWTVSQSSFTKSLSFGELSEASFTVTPKASARVGDYAISVKASFASGRKLAGSRTAIYRVR